MAESAPDSPGPVAALDALTEEAWETRRSDPRAALALADDAVRRARAAGERVQLGYALRTRGACRCLTFDNEGALADLAEASALFEAAGEARGLASARNWIGNVHWRRSDYPAALEAHLSALPLQREIGDLQGEADTLNGLGNVYFHIGEFDRALEAYDRSLRLREQLGDARGMCESLNNVGNIHAELGDLSTALSFHTRALQLTRELDYPRSEGIALGNVAMTLAAMGDAAGAREHYRQALEHGRAIGEPQLEANALLETGRLFTTEGELDRALPLLHEGQEVARAHGLPFVVVEALLALSEALLARDDAATALAHLQEALALAEGIHSRRFVYKVHRALSRTYERLGDDALALRHFKLFHEVEGEVFNTESDRRIQSILVQAQVERSQQEAELLRSTNTELKAVNRALEEAHDEKSRLLNQLQIQAGELERLTREDALTGLYNRRHLERQLAVEFERARRFQRDLSVAVADIDRFKTVNDRFTHTVGDVVLREVARILHRETRGIDTVGRYGGEEFVLILVETPLERALQSAERLRRVIESHPWREVHPGLDGLTISFGVASIAPEMREPAELFAAADARLFDAKRAGRNRVAGGAG